MYVGVCVSEIEEEKGFRMICHMCVGLCACVCVYREVVLTFESELKTAAVT